MNEKLDTAGIFERLFEVYKAQFSLLFPAAVIVFLPVALLNGAFVAGGGVGLVLVGALISIVAGFWLQGMVIEAVRDMQDGQRDFTLGGLFRSVVPVLPLLIGIGILAAIGITIGFVLLIVPGLILLTIWVVTGPAIVVERQGAIDAFGRSRELVRGEGWSVFGVLVVTLLIVIGISIVLAAIGAATGDAGQVILNIVASVVTAPIFSLVAAILFFDLGGGQGAASAAPAAPAQPPPPPASPAV
jgi:hypothetical protein